MTERTQSIPDGDEGRPGRSGPDGDAGQPGRSGNLNPELVQCRDELRQMVATLGALNENDLKASVQDLLSQFNDRIGE